jgi:hypothetical protein
METGALQSKIAITLLAKMMDVQRQQGQLVVEGLKEAAALQQEAASADLVPAQLSQLDVIV